MTLQRVLAPVVLLCGSLLVAFGVLEFSLRVLYPPPAVFVYPQEFYDIDPEIGYMLRPLQTAFTHDRPVRTSSLGLRDREIAPDPTPGTIRVLALGDSQTFGNGLAGSDTWPRQLERTLNETAPNRWEVVNAGVPGTDTWQHEILLRRLLKATRPHVVVLAFYVNDVAPRWNLRGMNTSGQTNTWKKRVTYLLKRSAVLTVIYHRLLPAWYAWQHGQGLSTEDAVLAGSHDEPAERGWRQVDQSLGVMSELCRAREMVFVVAILPRRDQVSGDRFWRAYNDRVRAIAEAHGIRVVDLLTSLSEAYRVRGDALFITWDGHNSAAANQVIAESLSPVLEDLVSQGERRHPAATR